MDDLLTARQVQDLLKVDRITVYRMLNDGRLRGNKIGQQWRFSRLDVENLVNGLKVGEDTQKNNEDTGLPVHCLQTIQNLFATVSQYSAVLISMQGNLITEMSSACEYCRFVCGQDSIKDLCRASHNGFVKQAQTGKKRFTCHAGLNYAGTVVQSAGEPIGLFLVGGYRREGVSPERGESPLADKAPELKIPGELLQSMYEKVPWLTYDQEEKLDTWTSATAQAFESILMERSAFARRLKKIADLTQIS